MTDVIGALRNFALERERRKMLALALVGAHGALVRVDALLRQYPASPAQRATADDIRRRAQNAIDAIGFALKNGSDLTAKFFQSLQKLKTDSQKLAKVMRGRR